MRPCQRCHRRVGPLALLLTAVLLAPGGCSGGAGDQSDSGLADAGGGADASLEETTVETTVPPTGGQVKLGQKVTLDVPEGAVSESTDITVTVADQPPPKGLQALDGRLYKFGPEGTTFDKPITVQFDYDGSAGKSVTIYWTQKGSEEFTALPTTVADGHLEAKVSHFSKGTPGRISACQTSADCPGAIDCIDGRCYVPNCKNSRTDGFETDTDCGGPSCTSCADGNRCIKDTDCMSSACSNNTCGNAARDTGQRDTDSGDTGVPDTAPADGGNNVRVPCCMGNSCAMVAGCQRAGGTPKQGSSCTEVSCQSSGSCTPGETVACGKDIGQCKRGFKKCKPDRTWGGCQGAISPERETCDAIDNDCDGEPDEGSLCGSGQSCQNGTCRSDSGSNGACCLSSGRCSQLSQRDCQSMGGMFTAGTSCGQVSCGSSTSGACCLGGRCTQTDATTCRNNGGTHHASQSCSQVSCGSSSCSDATQNGSETDVDCGGSSCPGCAAGENCSIDGDCKSGICTGGTCASSSCTSGATQPCGPSSSTGVCQQGIQQCNNGTWGSCTGAVRPSSETCDSKDNDCDGTVDEGSLCGSAKTCQSGSCQTSTSGACCVSARCTQLSQTDCNNQGGTFHSGQSCSRVSCP